MGELADSPCFGYSIAHERPELAAKLAVLEKRAKTMQAEYKADVARLAEDNAKREFRLIMTIAGLLAFAVAAIGLLIRWPE